MQKEVRSVMILSKSRKMIEFIKAVIPQDSFSPVRILSCAADARRTLLNTNVDIVIIHTPLNDEFGTKLAQDISKECAVAVIVKPELLEKAAYKLEPYGIVTLPSTLYKSVLYQTVMLLSSSVVKINRLKENSKQLREKLHEVRSVTKAKALLISERDMTEEQAHRYIEKTAMDCGQKKIDIAKSIIRDITGEE